MAREVSCDPKMAQMSQLGRRSQLVLCLKYCLDELLCRTMAYFECNLYTLISGGDHVVLALYRNYL